MFVFAHQGNCLFPSLFLCSLAFPERKRLGEWVGAQSPPNAPQGFLPTFAAVIDKVTEIHFINPLKRKDYGSNFKENGDYRQERNS